VNQPTSNTAHGMSASRRGVARPRGGVVAFVAQPGHRGGAGPPAERAQRGTGADE
jgi:hypothetical protein